MGLSPRLLRPRASGSVVSDANARAYISAVQAADGQALEPAVTKAINDFVVGCKADGTWSAIRASCILVGARTLSGALVPLAGIAPTNANFVSSDYNRKTGLLGGTTTYIDTRRNRLDDGQNDSHACVFVTQATSAGFARAFGVGNGTGQTHVLRDSNANNAIVGHGNATDTFVNTSGLVNFAGVSRSSAESFSYLINGVSGSVSAASQSRPSLTWYVFNRNPVSTPFNAGRIAFYSVGSALTLSLLRSRVDSLYAAIGAAIP